ncbi:MAG TPA: sensor histidine kinase [Lacunisphaera sp.]|jgi:signal transduction histidine kinase
MLRFFSRNTTAALGTGILLTGIFSALVVWFRSDLREEIRLKIIERDAAVLYPMALQQLADSDAGETGGSDPLNALLKSARQKGMLAVAIFDREGNTIKAVPASQLFVELPTEDYLQLQSRGPITRYHSAFPLEQYFAGVSHEQGTAPVLEVSLPLREPESSILRGFVRYYIDARSLAHELSLIDDRINRQTTVTLLVGTILIGLVMALATFSVQRAQRVIAERNARLIRTNFELTLAAKASAIGQITSHLIHGLQGSVEGLRSIVANRETGQVTPEWETAAGYTERLRIIIQETVALLGDASAHASYELTGYELATTIRERNQDFAREKSVLFEVTSGFAGVVDSHRGSLLCLIASNLVQNAITATDAGRRVSVSITVADRIVVLTVSDEGPGIDESVREHLFKPGRSSRRGGSGLGLAISQLLARQIGATLALDSTGKAGTTFRLTLPLGTS